jgi:hypothetical protein
MKQVLWQNKNHEAQTGENGYSEEQNMSVGEIMTVTLQQAF